MEDKQKYAAHNREGADDAPLHPGYFGYEQRLEHPGDSGRDVSCLWS